MQHGPGGAICVFFDAVVAGVAGRAPKGLGAGTGHGHGPRMRGLIPYQGGSCAGGGGTPGGLSTAGGGPARWGDHGESELW